MPREEYNCPEQKRLTNIETKVDEILLNREIPYIKKKIDTIIKKLDNGIISKVNQALQQQQQMSHDIQVLQNQIVSRPVDPDTNEPMERRVPPQQAPPPEKQIREKWNQLPIIKKWGVISIVLGLLFKQEIREFISSIWKAYIGQ